MQAAAGWQPMTRGVVHRDVSRLNTFWKWEWNARSLTDFGLARARTTSADGWGIHRRDAAYMVTGSRPRGEPLDAAQTSQFWGAAVRNGDGVRRSHEFRNWPPCRRLVDDAPQALASLNPELPPWFIRHCGSLLEKDRHGASAPPRKSAYC